MAARTCSTGAGRPKVFRINDWARDWREHDILDSDDYYQFQGGLSAAVERASGRVIVATFASNISRIQEVINTARRFDRRVGVVGRSMEQNFRIAVDLGYLKHDPGRIVAKDQIAAQPASRIVIATTGAQGEPIPPGQQHVHDGNLIVRGFRKGDQQRDEGPSQPDQFEVEPEQNGPRPHGDRMVGEGEANLRVER